MKTQVANTGYYSVVQFCPDRARLEVVNIGVVVICPATGFVDVKLSSQTDRIRRFFGSAAPDKSFLAVMRHSFRNRLFREIATNPTPEALRKLATRLGNELVLTPPRTMRVEDAAHDLDELYAKLVSTRATAHRRESDAIVETTLRQPRMTDRILYDREIKSRGVSIRAPYMYVNGTLNLIKPQGFSPQNSSALQQLERVIGEHALLQRAHSIDDLGYKLIVVCAHELEGWSRDHERKVLAANLELVDIEYVPYNRRASFVRMVEREAKPISDTVRDALKECATVPS